MQSVEIRQSLTIDKHKPPMKAAFYVYKKLAFTGIKQHNSFNRTASGYRIFQEL